MIWLCLFLSKTMKRTQMMKIATFLIKMMITATFLKRNCRCFLCWKMGLSPLAWTEDWFIKTMMMFYLVNRDYKWIENFCNGVVILHKMIMWLIVLSWAPQEYLAEHHRARKGQRDRNFWHWQLPNVSLCVQYTPLRQLTLDN